jgi:predicted nuclease of predicted toxin-antitoxin system
VAAQGKGRVDGFAREGNWIVRPSDAEIFLWAQAHQAIVVTYDEDFADARLFPLGTHSGVIRLRVGPTTVEKTEAAMERLLKQVPAADWPGNLIIIDNDKIRLRRP